MWRYRLIRLLPFLSRWIEVSPACCGVCPTCLTTTAGNLLLPMLSDKHREHGAYRDWGADA
jgi:hypothetical protein